ncbi:hypothetical protein ACQ4PT_019396 [Festuca glaucescens]
METASKVEVAIKKFRDNQKLTAGGSHEKKETAKIRMVNSPIKFVAKETVNITTDEKNDPMAEFDQFFLFKESEKAKEVLNAEIRRNISPIVSDGLDKSNEEGIVNSTDVLLTIEVVDQVNEEAGTSKTNDDSSEEEDLHGTDDNNKRGPEYFFPTPEEISNLQSPEEGTTFPTLDATVRFVNVYAHVKGESFNSSFKDYILQKDTIENFLKQYELFLENVLEIENDDRFQSTQKEPVLWCRQPIERHAAGVYTRGIYLKFVTELMNSTAFGVTEVVKDQVYELRKLFYYEKAKYRRNLFTVFVDCEEMIVEYQYIMPRWTTEFREKELVKHKQECLDKHGSNVTHQLLVYATLMNSMNDVCADISRDVDKSREFIEEVQKLHKRLMSEPNKQSSNSIMLKVPPVIRKSSSKNNKDPASEVGSVPETSTSHAGKNINIWVNADGSTSNPVEAKDRNKKKKQKIDAGSSLKDPPVGTSKSVEKGNRMKPQSEINSQKKKNPKKRNQGV